MKPSGIGNHFVLFCLLWISSTLAYINFPIGAIFDRRETEIQSAFRYAIWRHNSNTTRQAVNLNAMTASINSGNGFELSKAMCNEMAHGIFFILGTKNLKTANVIQSYTNTFHMPYLTIGPVPKQVPYSNDFLLHLRPSFTATLVDVIRHFDWNTLHYLYDSYEGLMRVESIITELSDDLQFTDKLDVNPVEIVDINNAHAALKSIDTWKSKKTPPVDEEAESKDSQQKAKDEREAKQEEMFPMRIIVLDVDNGARLQLLLRQLQEMGMNRPRYHYVIASLDVSEVELSGFIHSGVNITGFRLIDQQSKFVQTFLKQWSSLSENSWPGTGQLRLGVDVALVVDAISLMIHSLDSLMTSNHEKFRRNFRRGMVYNSNDTRIMCEANSKPWEHGQLLVDEVKKSEMYGLTGLVAFNENGYRTGYRLDVMTLIEKVGMRKVGFWDEEDAGGGRMVATDQHWKELRQEYEYDDKTYKVTTIPTEPFLMVKQYDDEGKPLIGNDRFIGYCADLIKHVAAELKFHYVIRPVADYKFGAKDKVTGNWDGMVGEIVDEKADLAVAPLTITSIRERVVDFSKPFMNLGISIMIKKPEKSKPGVFSFMDPFSKRLWICITVACLSVGLVLFGVGRISPYQWEITESPGEEPEVETEVTLFNTIWYSLGALMSQGGEMTLKSMSTRLVGSVWSLFTLIVISSYTANLAAFLTVESLVTPIDSASDLAAQTKIQYGSLGGGSTESFFFGTNISLYKKMWKYMDSALPSVWVNTTEDGIARVRNQKGKYAFLLESTVNDYTNQRKPCNTMKVGDNLDSKGYGMATQMGNPLRKRLNLAVLKLLEDSVLHELKKKWWYDKSECMFEEEGSSSNPLTLSNVAGIFYILMSGFGLAMVVSFIEFIHRSRKHKDKRQMSLFDAIQTKVDSTISCRAPGDSRTAIYGPQNGNGGMVNRGRYSSVSPPVHRTGAISLV